MVDCSQVNYLGHVELVSRIYHDVTGLFGRKPRNINESRTRHCPSQTINSHNSEGSKAFRLGQFLYFFDGHDTPETTNTAAAVRKLELQFLGHFLGGIVAKVTVGSQYQRSAVNVADCAGNGPDGDALKECLGDKPVPEVMEGFDWRIQGSGGVMKMASGILYFVAAELKNGAFGMTI